MRSITRRINKLERQQAHNYADVVSWIREGRYYDELSDSEKERYCSYRNCDRIGLEQVVGYFFDGLHVPLERRPAPPTEAERVQRVKDIEEWFRRTQTEYNIQKW